MSFILNALRKSEQERQALQPESVTDRILLHQPQQKRSKTAKFYAFLIIANVLIIASIVWFVLNIAKPPPDPIAQTNSKPLLAQETRLKSNVIAESMPQERPAQKEEAKTTSIGEWVEAQKPEPAPLPIKPVIPIKPAPETIKHPTIANKPELLLPTTPEIATAVKVEPDPPETNPIKNDIPFLSDLSFEFRQSVPKFNINVFVYSQYPEERFVMIDMIKYTPGQHIKDTMILKEIRPESLVVVYQNQTFQIKRP